MCCLQQSTLRRRKFDWICIIIHALVDFGGLMASGIFGNGDMTDMIGSLSVLNLVVTVPLFLVPCIVY